MLSDEESDKVHSTVRGGDVGKISTLLTVLLARHLQVAAGVQKDPSGLARDHVVAYAMALEANPKTAVELVLYFANSEAQDSLKRIGIALS